MSELRLLANANVERVCDRSKDDRMTFVVIEDAKTARFWRAGDIVPFV